MFWTHQDLLRLFCRCLVKTGQIFTVAVIWTAGTTAARGGAVVWQIPSRFIPDMYHVNSYVRDYLVEIYKVCEGMYNLLTLPVDTSRGLEVARYLLFCIEGIVIATYSGGRSCSHVRRKKVNPEVTPQYGMLLWLKSL